MRTQPIVYPAPSKWSFEKIDHLTWEVYVDGISTGKGTLLFTCKFDHIWSEDAQKANLNAICYALNKLNNQY